MFLEPAFYFAHRALHHPALYARFHKQHHEYKGSVGFAAEYATLVEQVCARLRLHLWLADVLSVSPHPSLARRVHAHARRLALAAVVLSSKARALFHVEPSRCRW